MPKLPFSGTVTPDCEGEFPDCTSTDRNATLNLAFQTAWSEFYESMCHAPAFRRMIREACKVLARIKSGKDEEARGILRVILEGIDLFGEAGANPRGACKNVQELRALTKNTANWEGMVLRNDSCNPREGVR